MSKTPPLIFYGAPFAVPSWVVPGTLWDNCAFLSGKVAEVALLFFETKASLAYGRQDLPLGLADLGLSFHVHLPLDLPWEDGGVAVAAICDELMAKVAFVGAQRAVLHPPAACGSQGCPQALLAAFAKGWVDSGRMLSDVLLENTRENDLMTLGKCVVDHGFGLCLDLGHMLAYEQRGLYEDIAAGVLPLGVRPRMVHINAPGDGLPGGESKSAHLPLDVLDASGLALGNALCGLLDDNGVVVAEFFNWGHVIRSMPILDRWRGRHAR